MSWRWSYWLTVHKFKKNYRFNDPKLMGWSLCTNETSSTGIETDGVVYFNN